MPRYDYDVIVVGGGAAGLTAGGFAATLGARTALIERDRLGGDCTWHGCVPSKTLLKAARTAHLMKTADRFGLRPSADPVDFPAVMEQVRRVRQRIYEEADSPEQLQKRNIDVLSGGAWFADQHTLIVRSDAGVRHVTARYVILCTGSRPVIPQLPGLTPDLMLTNENLFELTELPRRLAVVGGGPVGMEMAQAFNRLGSRVTVVEMNDEVLSGGEPECSAFIRRRLEAEGVTFHRGSTAVGIERDNEGALLQIEQGDHWSTVRFDRVLVSAGRRPNVESLHLEAAEVKYDEHGVKIDRSCQTSTPHIYACGDVTGGMNFTHVAENMAKTAVTRLLLKIPASYETDVVPSVVYTDPEWARVGCTARELTLAKERFETVVFPFSMIDRAITEGEDEGMIMLHHTSGGKILGAHIAGAGAGEMVNEIALAMHNGLTLRDISDTVHAYPTMLLGVRRAADQWYVRRASPTMIGLLKKVFGYRGNPPDSLGTDSIV